MRITRFLDPQGNTRYGVDLGDGTAGVLAGEALSGLAPTGETTPIAVRLAPLEPVNILGIGLNYHAHAREMAASVPDYPVLFMKPTSTLNHPGAPIPIPACCAHGPEVDYEGELAVVIGRAARNVPEVQALAHVLGYTVTNDLSARRWQKHGGAGQWVRGKSFDGFCPIGPVLVTADELPDPQELTIRTYLNGEQVQAGNTSDMIFSVARIIAELSRDTTLLPGTLILTGTPPGVGMARTPPRFLHEGDRVEVEIEGIGRLSNPITLAEP